MIINNFYQWGFRLLNIIIQILLNKYTTIAQFKNRSYPI
jgi:hypothetical protein